MAEKSWRERFTEKNRELGINDTSKPAKYSLPKLGEDKPKKSGAASTKSMEKAYQKLGTGTRMDDPVRSVRRAIPIPRLRPAREETAAPKSDLKTVPKKAAPKKVAPKKVESPKFRGNWIGATSSAMQGGAGKKMTNFQRTMKRSREK